MATRRVNVQGERGQTMAEYAVVLGVITFAIVTSFSFLAGAVEAALNEAVEIVRNAV